MIAVVIHFPDGRKTSGWLPAVPAVGSQMWISDGTVGKTYYVTNVLYTLNESYVDLTVSEFNNQLREDQR